MTIIFIKVVGGEMYIPISSISLIGKREHEYIANKIIYYIACNNGYEITIDKEEYKRIKKKLERL